MPKISTWFFWASSAFSLFFGVLYLVWPIAPYHEKIIGMSFPELLQGYPGIARLIITLVNVVGIGFLAVGLYGIYIGHRAWQDRYAWISAALVLGAFYLPAVYIVYGAGGPVLLSMIPAALQTVALLVSAGLDRAWRKGTPAALNVP